MRQRREENKALKEENAKPKRNFAVLKESASKSKQFVLSLRSHVHEERSRSYWWGDEDPREFDGNDMRAKVTIRSRFNLAHGLWSRIHRECNCTTMTIASMRNSSLGSIHHQQEDFLTSIAPFNFQ